VERVERLGDTGRLVVDEQVVVLEGRLLDTRGVGRRGEGEEGQKSGKASHAVLQETVKG
jgi:hypothetical protein